MNGVTSRGRRQRVCERAREREGAREWTERERGEAGIEALCFCSALYRPCLVPIHHLSGISQGVMRNVHSCERTRKRERKWKNPFAPDVDTTARIPDHERKNDPEIAKEKRSLVNGFSARLPNKKHHTVLSCGRDHNIFYMF